MASTVGKEAAGGALLMYLSYETRLYDSCCTERRKGNNFNLKKT